MPYDHYPVVILPSLAHHHKVYITVCHVCQMFKEGYRLFQKRININTPTLTKISIDIKYMPNLTKQYKYIPSPFCEITNFLIALPLKTTLTADSCTAIMDGCIKYFGLPTYIIGNQDPAFMHIWTSILPKI